MTQGVCASAPVRWLREAIHSRSYVEPRWTVLLHLLGSLYSGLALRMQL